MTNEQRKRLKRIMKDGRRIQDRFAAEPVLATTGKGFLKGYSRILVAREGG